MRRLVWEENESKGRGEWRRLETAVKRDFMDEEESNKLYLRTNLVKCIYSVNHICNI